MARFDSTRSHPTLLCLFLVCMPLAAAAQDPDPGPPLVVPIADPWQPEPVADQEPRETEATGRELEEDIGQPVPANTGRAYTALAPAFVRYEEGDPEWALTGSWSSLTLASASGGSHARSGTANDTAQLNFSGTWLNLGFVADRFSGEVEVLIDGISQGVFDLYRRTVTPVTLAFDGLSPGLHTVEIVVLGTSNPLSSNQRVQIDYADSGDGSLLPDGMFEDGDARILLSNGWNTSNNVLASGGTMLTSTSGTAWFPFSGDSFSLHTLAYSNAGRVRLYVDGQPLDTIDLYEPVFSSSAEVRVFSYEGFGSGDHVLTIASYQYSAVIDRIDTPGVAPFIDPDPPVTGVTRYESDHPALRFNDLPLTQASTSWETTGNLLSAGASQGETSHSALAGDVISLEFDSDWLGLGMIRTDDGGQAEIAINGDVVDTLDLYSRYTNTLTRVYRDLGPGPHSLTITVLGTASPQSNGTDVTLDYIDLWDGQPLADGSFENDHPERIRYCRSWSRQSSPDASSGTYATSSGFPNASAWFHFDGDSLTWQGWSRFNYQDVEFLVDGQTVAVKDLYDLDGGPRSFSLDGFGPGLHLLEVRQVLDNAASFDLVTTPAIGMPEPQPPTPAIVRFEENYPNLTYNGQPTLTMPISWTEGGLMEASRGYYHSSSTPGDVWRIDFEGQWIALGFRSTASSGTAEVFIDGVSQGVIDTSDGVGASKVFTYGGLSAGPHVVEVVVLTGPVMPDFADVWAGQNVADGWYDLNLDAAPQDLRHLSLRQWWRRVDNEYAFDDDYLTPFVNARTNTWFTFTGNALTVLANERDGRALEIVIDGVEQGSFDVSTTPPFRAQPRAIHFNTLGEGPHVVQVYTPSSGGAAGIDGFEVNPADFSTHKPTVEWFDTTAQETLPGGDGTGFLSTIAIGDLEGDGLVELIAPGLNGRLYVYRGDGQDAGGGSPILWSSDLAGPTSEPALADLDGDGIAEIIVSGRDGTFAFQHDGQLLWSNPLVTAYYTSQDLPFGGPTVANLDLDPEPEIAIASVNDALYVLDHEGNIEFSDPLGSDFVTVPVLADLTGDGILDIVVAESWTLKVIDYQNGGTVVWSRELPDPLTNLFGPGAFGSPAIADLDGDGRAEVIINWGHVIEALEDDGTLLWRYETGRTDLYRPSPVTVADVTGDGQVDLVTASAISSGLSVFNHLMMVVDAGGSLVWEQTVADTSASASGVAAQDLTGNGAWEILWNGSQDGFLILNGPDGDRLYNEPYTGSGTVLDYPTLADVDGDGEAEVITAGTNGLFVFGHQGRWADSRPVWNQHNYHINNINNDWSVPFTQENSWETHNTYRTQTPDRDPGCVLEDGEPVPPSFVELSPEPGAVLPSGIPLVISGRVLPVVPRQPVLSVTVNGAPVDLLDASGAFFALVELPSGENSLQLQASDRCGAGGIALGLNGGRDDADPWADLADASVLLEARFASTTRDRANERLLVDVQALNAGPSVPGPILMAIGNDADPTLGLLNADGFTPQGEPYVVIVPDGELLPAGGLSAVRELGFTNPQQRPIDFTPRWIAPVNQPPAFITIPEPRATVGQLWTYAAGTLDGNGDPVTLQLRSAPGGMSVVGSEVLWTPSQVGNFEIVIEASDGRGGIATQGFTVQVSDASFNRPPVFTSSPQTQRPVGATYIYNAAASDLDGDALSFSLQAAPAGVTVDPVNGEVRWDSAQPGQHSLVLNLDDGRGGQATQAWTLYVGEPALTEPGPAFSSVPVTYATPGVQYRYVFRVNIPQPTAPVVSLSQAPPTMVLDTVAGTLAWVPTGADLGTHVIELLAVDSNGEEARQRFDLQVLPELPNQPPYLTSSPVLNARIGSPYSYLARAIDPEFEALSFSLSSAPAGMAMNPTTGEVDWVPQAADPPTNDVIVHVQDPQGGQASQSFTIQLRSSNVDPAITTAPVTTATVGEFYSTRLLASDADADPVRFTLLQGPSSMTLHPTLGWLHWTTTGETPGVYPVVIEVTDDWGGRQALSFDLTLLPDTEAPVVAVTMVPAPACQRELAAVCVVASDNVGLSEVSLTLDGEVMTLDASRCTLWTPLANGLIPVLAVATDPSGLTRQDTAPLTVIDCNDEQAPVVTLETELTGEAYNQPVPIVVTIEDNTPDILTWEVTRRALGADEAVVLATGTGPVAAAEVAVFDPTVLQSGDFEIIVEASDGAQTGGISFILASGTGNKPGRVAFATSDLSWPLGALPLTIGRSYDSLDAVPMSGNSGDFSPGWRLALSASVVDSAPDQPEGAFFLSGEPFTNQTRVTVVKPNGERVGFRFNPQLNSFPGILSFKVEYLPDAGVTDTLRAVDWPETIHKFGNGFANYIIPYNPTVYELETEEGLVFVISEVDGLLEVRDTQGGVLTSSTNGWQSSWGARVDYVRDGEGRITDIVLIDEDGTSEIGRLVYGYDTNGNLASVTDLAGGVSTFEYGNPDYPHHVTALFDALGQPIARMVFDDQGRQIAHCPGDADPVTLDGCNLFQFAVDGVPETVFDSRGLQSQFFYDDQGLLILQRDEVDLGVFVEERWTYDDQGRLIEYVDRDGGITLQEWGEEDNRTVLVEPDGRRWTWSWGECTGEDEWLSRCDALGNCYEQELDASCRTTRRSDPLGGDRVVEYDEVGLPISHTDPVGEAHGLDVNAQGQLVGFSDPLGGEVVSEFGELGELLVEIRQDGIRREFDYDEGLQLEGERWIGAGVGPSGYTWNTNSAGQIDAMTWPGATVSMTYWPNGLVRRMTHSSPTAPDWWIEYTYDGSDNVIRLEDSFGGITEYDYNGLNQVTELRQSGVGVLPKRIVFDNSGAGLPLSLQRFASLDDSAPGPMTEMDYACLSCPDTLSRITHRRPDSGVIEDIVLQRDERRQLVGRTDADGSHAFVLDGRGWLISADYPPAFPTADQSFTWDGSGNWLGRSGDFGGANTATLGYQTGQGGHRLLSDGVNTYQYDARGSMIERSWPGGRLEIQRDGRGNPVTITEFDGGNQVVSTASYVYSSNQQRVRADRDGVVRHYIFDGPNPIIALDDAGQVVWRLLHPRSVDRPLAMEVGGELRWLLSDHIGSVRRQVDNDGQVIAAFTYDAFGRQLSGPAPTIDDPVRYTGRDFDLPGDLGFFRLRLYDPAIGRFLSDDPIEPWHYRYADNNPLNLVDPSGAVALVEYAIIVCKIAGTLADANEPSKLVAAAWSGDVTDFKVAIADFWIGKAAGLPCALSLPSVGGSDGPKGPGVGAMVSGAGG